MCVCVCVCLYVCVLVCIYIFFTIWYTFLGELGIYQYILILVYHSVCHNLQVLLIRELLLETDIKKLFRLETALGEPVAGEHC